MIRSWSACASLAFTLILVGAALIPAPVRAGQALEEPGAVRR